MRADDPRCPFCDARPRNLATAVTLGATLGACGARDLPHAETDATTTTTTTTTSSSSNSATTFDTIDTSDPTTASATTPGTTMTSETGPIDTGTSVAESSSSDDEGSPCGFYGGCPSDFGTSLECDVFAQDCPRGEKCMPWGNDIIPYWNATRCSPVDPDPDQVGEPCTVEGGPVSGIDSCALGSMCFDVDVDTNTGTCVDLCTGSEANPVCADPQTSCAILFGIAPVCLPTCDPLVQDCVEGENCYVADDEFLCFAPAGPTGGHGDACSYFNPCDPGLQCIEGANVSGCVDAACCSEFCDLGAPDPDASCSAAVDGETCTVLLDGFPNVGVCRLPD